MITDSTYRAATSDGMRRELRDARLSYRGITRLLVNVPPMQLALHLNGVNLSQTGICTHLPEDHWDDGDPGVLFAIGDLYELQLEHSFDHLPAPLLQGKLVRSVRLNTGRELAFTVLGPAANLLGLLQELKQQQHDAEKRS